MRRFSNNIKCWPIILAAGFFLLYLLLLDPVSGAVGGFFFFFLAFPLASAANVFVSYWLASLIITRKIFMIPFMIIISCALGLNVLLISRIISTPTDIKVTVIKPLTLPNKKSFIPYHDFRTNSTTNDFISSISFSKSNATVRPFLINIFRTDMNEGCGCMYFYNIPAVYTHGSMQQMLQEYFVAAIKQYGDKLNDNSPSPKYNVSTSLNDESKEMSFDISIEDSLGGKVVISTNYSHQFYVNSLSDYNKLLEFPDNYSVKEGMTTFTYSNFWAMYLGKYLRAPMIDTATLLKHPEMFGYPPKESSEHTTFNRDFHGLKNQTSQKTIG